MSNSFVTLWTAAHQVSLSMEFPRQEYWSRLPFPSPGALPDSVIEPRSPALQADSRLSKPYCHTENDFSHLPLQMDKVM